MIKYINKIFFSLMLFIAGNTYAVTYDFDYDGEISGYFSFNESDISAGFTELVAYKSRTAVGKFESFDLSGVLSNLKEASRNSITSYDPQTGAIKFTLRFLKKGVYFTAMDSIAIQHIDYRHDIDTKYYWNTLLVRRE